MGIRARVREEAEITTTRVETRTREEWTYTGHSGRVLVTAGRIVGGRRVTLSTGVPAPRLDAPTCRALAAWLLVQAAEMEADAADREAE
ncbi:hypothetical protein [Nocardiopsis alba]|uniref:hypothetical protein n=1 Tax=Nocardiopsis alba TaxID=53437 RepID=UPI003D73ADEA